MSIKKMSKKDLKDLKAIEEAKQADIQFKAVMAKIFIALDELGYSAADIKYAIGLYTELHRLGLLESKYFNIKQQGKKVNISNFGELVKYPEFFYNTVMLFLNSNDFLTDYQVDFKEDGSVKILANQDRANQIVSLILSSAKDPKKTKVTYKKIRSYLSDNTENDTNEDIIEIANLLISKGVMVLDDENKEVEITEEHKKATFVTPFDKFKVAEDENYVSFIMTSANKAKSLRNFYSIVYDSIPPEADLDPRLVKSASLKPKWCIASSSAGSYFYSQKRDTDVWIITFPKKHPLDILSEYLNKDEIEATLAGGNKHGSLYHSAANAFNQLGEVYLKDTVENRDVVNRRGNYGHHNFLNSPGSGEDHTRFEIEPSYEYKDIDISDFIESKSMEISGNTLVSVGLSDNNHIIVPNGITVIKEGAFVGFEYLKEVSLPLTTAVIESGAFIDCPRLSIVKASNNLRIIGKRAFFGRTPSQVKVGVLSFERTEGGSKYIIVSKPKNLITFPRSIDLWVESTEAGNNVLRESGESEMPEVLLPYHCYEDTLFSVENGIVFSIGDIQDNKKTIVPEMPKIILPDGIKRFSSLMHHTIQMKTDFLKFPSSFISLENFSLSQDSKVDTIHMYNANTTVIPVGAFSYADVKTIILPRVVNVIEGGAIPAFLETIIIPSSITNIDWQAFKYAQFISEIITDNVEALKKAMDDQLRSLGTTDLIKKRYQKLNDFMFDNPLIEVKKG